MFTLGWDETLARLMAISQDDVRIIILAMLKMLYYWWPVVLAFIVMCVYLAREEAREEEMARLGREAERGRF